MSSRWSIRKCDYNHVTRTPNLNHTTFRPRLGGVCVSTTWCGWYISSIDNRSKGPCYGHSYRCAHKLPELQIHKVLPCVSSLLCGPILWALQYSLAAKRIFMSNKRLRNLEMKLNLSRYHSKGCLCEAIYTIVTILVCEHLSWQCLCPSPLSWAIFRRRELIRATWWR